MPISKINTKLNTIGSIQAKTKSYKTHNQNFQHPALIKKEKSMIQNHPETMIAGLIKVW